MLLVTERGVGMLPFLPAFRAVERNFLQKGSFANPVTGSVTANEAEYPFSYRLPPSLALAARLWADKAE